MKNDFVSLSLELHLFFGRIMKEHSLFLMAGFPAKNADHIRKADWFRKQFEALLRETVSLADNHISDSVLQSGEVVTMYTANAERRTSFLSGIPIDFRITSREQRLRSCCDNSGCEFFVSGEMLRRIRRLNQTALRLVKGLISFKEQLLREINSCRLFTFNYPLLIEHILREARQKDCRACDGLCEKSLQETLKYRDFKAAGTKGITECKIAGLIPPLLADHVLREANHYLRLLESDC